MVDTTFIEKSQNIRNWLDAALKAINKKGEEKQDESRRKDT